jgi:transcriptional regulator with XRE-family HTH domain
MDYARLGSELLRTLRGKRSQAALARRLGYRANVAHTWERGTRFPDAQILFRLGALAGVDSEAVAGFVKPAVPSGLGGEGWSAESTAAFLRALVGEAPLVDVARSIGVDRTTVRRWLQGSTEPRVPELLALVDASTQRLVEFVSLFVDPARLEVLRELSSHLVAQRRMAYELPWSHAVLRALELGAYRRLPAHVDGFVARAIGVDLDTERVLLEELRSARLIRRQRGKWAVVRVLTVDTRSDPERDFWLKEHWASVGLERLRRRPSPTEGFHSYSLACVSHEDVAKLRELHLEYFGRLRRIIAESRLAERVVLIRQELVPLDETQPTSDRPAATR